MISPSLTGRLSRRLPAVAALVLAMALTASAQAATHAKTEPYSALVGQISSGQVKAATVVSKKHTANVKLRNGVKYRVTYPASTDLVASLRAHGAHVRVKKTPATGSHIRLRYIVLAVVAALAIAGGVAYLVRRRRPPEPGPAAGV